jgi:Fic family protein
MQESDHETRTVYFDIDDKTESLRRKLKTRKELSQKFHERFEVSWIYHENAMEGFVLDLFDIKAALDHATLEDGVLIPTYQRIRNLKNAIEKVRKAALESSRAPTLQFIKNLHLILSHGISGQTGGVYRKEIPIHRTYFHDIAPPTRIPSLMAKLVADLGKKEFKQLHPIRQAAEVHYRMMNVFPFDDDTGKVARLLMNFFVIRNNYFPVIIPDIERQQYYDALRIGWDFIHALTVECLERQLDQSLRFFRAGGVGAVL